MISLLIRTQLNLIGRHVYLDSVDDLEDMQENEKTSDKKQNKVQFNLFTFCIHLKEQSSLSFDVERKYLALSWYFLKHGVRELQHTIEGIVAELLNEYAILGYFIAFSYLMCSLIVQLFPNDAHERSAP
jgi:hypothetical protein